MPSIGPIFWKTKSVFSRPFCCAKIVPLAILFVVAGSILPALASEAPESNQSGRTVNARGHATAVASARVVKPFSMISAVQAATKSHDYGITVLPRTTVRDCSVLLGADANLGTAASCELRLIELQ
tara:strand:+ start:2009 stop:2386 length:378 start_codon:yes stop_codon:yes gene_type:complete